MHRVVGVRGLSLLCLSLVGLAACSTPQVQEGASCPRTPVLSGATAVMEDGVALPVELWRPEGAVSAVVLALHGFDDYRHAFADLGAFLAGHGIVTCAFDQRGFGSTAQRGIWAGTERMVADASVMADLVRAQYPNVPMFLLGESMGGAVLMTMMARPGRPDCDGMILVAPAVWGRVGMNPALRALLWLGAHTVPALKLTGKTLDVTPSDNKEMLRALGEDPLVIKKTRVDALYGLADLMSRALASAPDLTVPVLLLYGERDEVIPKRPVCMILEGLSEAQERLWRIGLYPEGYHMLTRDLQAEVVLRDIASWIVDSAAPLPSGCGVELKGPVLSSFCE
jgi:acylglycerol lipase